MTSPREVLIIHLVDPVLGLKKTHPEYSFTRQGYDTLIDNALSVLSKIVLSKQKQITQSYDDFVNGYETGYRSAITDIAKLFEEESK